MKRIIWDVPKWSLYLHRSARLLPRAQSDDARDRKLEDELFEKLFTGDVDLLPPEDRDPIDAGWAGRIHSAVSQLPVFERLAQQCRGRVDESALAVETIIDELRSDAPVDELRRSMRSACGKATTIIEELQEALEGLDHVAFGPAAGDGHGQHAAPIDHAGVRSLAGRLRESSRLREIARLAGRFKRIAGTKRRSRVQHGADEIVDVEIGADLGRLLPLELALLVHPSTRLLAMRNLHERNCLQYRLDGAEMLGKGPLVVAIDKSGSMEGEKDIWASAVALALLDTAQAEKRSFALLCFDATVKHETVVQPGGALPESALFVEADGGTDIDKVIHRGLDIIEEAPGRLRQADIVLITDGGSSSENAATLRERAARLGVTVFGVGIDVDPDRLRPWCDVVIGEHDMSRMETGVADTLFQIGG